jgi:hypothetical protein
MAGNGSIGDEKVAGKKPVHPYRRDSDSRLIVKPVVMLG